MHIWTYSLPPPLFFFLLPLGILALKCTHNGWSYGANLWWMFVLWTTNRKWILLRHVPWGWVGFIYFFLFLATEGDDGYIKVWVTCKQMRNHKCKWECCALLLVYFRGVSSNDFSALETLCKKIMKEKQPFERLEVKKETLLEMFKVSCSWLLLAHHAVTLWVSVTLATFSVVLLVIEEGLSKSFLKMCSYKLICDILQKKKKKVKLSFRLSQINQFFSSRENCTGWSWQYVWISVLHLFSTDVNLQMCTCITLAVVIWCADTELCMLVHSESFIKYFKDEIIKQE